MRNIVEATECVCKHCQGTGRVDGAEAVRSAWPEKTTLHAIIINHLLDRPNGSSKDQLVTALWGGRRDGGPDSALSVFYALISQCRVKLGPLGYTILRESGVYYLTRLSNRVEQ